ncbi:hypothetical protein ACG7TL_002371 [Trametes sanguinea]
MPVSTRSANTQVRPGVVDAPKSRRTTAQVKAAKKAQTAEAKAKEKKKEQRQTALAVMELEMEGKEREIRKRREQRTKSTTTKRKRSSVVFSSDDEGSKKKKKRSKQGVAESEAEAFIDDDAPTPSPYEPDESSSAASDLSSLSDDEVVVEETPKPKKKKRAAKEPLRAEVEAAKTRLARSDVEDAVSEAPSSMSTATEERTSRISAWAASARSAVASTPTTVKSGSSSQPSIRTAAIPATPYMPARATNGKAKPPAKQVERSDSEREARESAGKKVRPRAVKHVKQEPLSDAEGVGAGGYVGTEDEDVEAIAAQASPVKNGVRLTNSAIVGVEDVDLTTPGKPKARKGKPKAAASSKSSEKSTSATTRTASAISDAGSNEKPIRLDLDDEDDEGSVKGGRGSKGRAPRRNSSLPQGAQDGNRWKGVFVPTLLKALGTRDDPWNVTDQEMVAIMQSIWDATYGSRLPFTIKVNDAVHALASQRIYEWRSAFGSAALQSFDSFFNSMGNDFPDIQSRQAFCSSIKDNGRLFYKEPEGDTKKGLYRSPFVIAVLAVHMSAIHGAIHVPSLYANPMDEYPYGAIGLSAAAAFRVCALWDQGKMTCSADGISSIIRAKNPHSGKARTKESDFSSANCSRTTTQCARSARNKLSPGSIQKIVEEACIHARLPTQVAASKGSLNLASDFNFEELTEVPAFSSAINGY